MSLEIILKIVLSWSLAGHQGLQTGNIVLLGDVIALLGDVTDVLGQFFERKPFSFPVREESHCLIAESATSFVCSVGDGGGDG